MASILPKVPGVEPAVAAEVVPFEGAVLLDDIVPLEGAVLFQELASFEGAAGDVALFGPSSSESAIGRITPVRSL